MSLKAKADEWRKTLEARRPLLPLKPEGPVDPEADEAIDGLLKGAGGDPDARAVVSGLLLWNGNLDRSHAISQGIGNATGSYWHGIMHRMEGDYWNAKYWFRKVGRHPAMERLREAADGKLAAFRPEGGSVASEADRLIGRLAAEGKWDPFLFVDAVEAQTEGRGSEAARALLEELQHLEISVLMAHGLERV